MSSHLVRVVAHHGYPALLRTLSDAKRTGAGEDVAAVVDRAQSMAVVIAGLRDAEAILLDHSARGAGVSSVALNGPGPQGTGGLALFGSFREHLDLCSTLKEEHGALLDLASEIKRAIYRYRERTFTLSLPGGSELELGPRTLVMGVVNVTPDSFSDGGETLDADRAVERGKRLVAEGADILDVGGESTRPGAAPVPPKEEQERVLPVIERLAAEVDVPVSVDTRRGATAREALRAGARILNDVSGLGDPLTGAVAARTGAPLVLMHMRGTPEDMHEHSEYRDVLGEIALELEGRIGRAMEAGVEEGQIVLDPGIGFAKTGAQSLEIIRRLAELRTLGRPLLVGPSRKSFLREVRDAPPEDRLHLTLGAVIAAVANGAHIVRVHDVCPVVDAIRAFEASR